MTVSPSDVSLRRPDNPSRTRSLTSSPLRPLGFSEHRSPSVQRVRQTDGPVGGTTLSVRGPLHSPRTNDSSE